MSTNPNTSTTPADAKVVLPKKESGARKQISVSLSPEQADQFFELMIETRDLRASSVLLSALAAYAASKGVDFAL